MHRPSRVSGDLPDHPLRSSENHNPATDETSEGLPRYNPQSYIAIKEHNQIRSAEAAIHLTPLLLSDRVSNGSCVCCCASLPCTTPCILYWTLIFPFDVVKIFTRRE
ncbi:hypothetical protein LXL04_001324 [Taraxacum kok-saghyz]